MRDGTDSSEGDTAQRAEVGKPHMEQVRLAFGELFTGGAFNMGRMCVECQHCDHDAMLWVCGCNKVNALARSLAVSPGHGSLTASR